MAKLRQKQRNLKKMLLIVALGRHIAPEYLNPEIENLYSPLRPVPINWSSMARIWSWAVILVERCSVQVDEATVRGLMADQPT